MPYTSLFSQEEERPTTGAGYTSVFGGGEKEEEKNWASMTPEERLRAFQRRYPGATPGINPKLLPGASPAVERQDPAQEVDAALSGFVTTPSGEGGVREGLGRVAESVAGLADLPALVGSILSAPPPEAYLGAQIAGDPITPEREQGMRAAGAQAGQALVPGFIERPREAIRANYQRIREREVEEGVEAGKSPVRIASEDTLKDVVAMVFDPLNWVGGGGALKGGRAIAREGAEGAGRVVAREAAEEAAESAPRVASHAGQAGESPEAIARVARGERYYRVSPGGEVTPIPNTVDAVDMRVNPGEAKVRVTSQGTVEIDQGGRGGPAQSAAIDRLRRERPAPEPRELSTLEPRTYELDAGEGLPSEFDPFDELQQDFRDEFEGRASAASFEPESYSVAEVRKRRGSAPTWMKLKSMEKVRDRWARGEISDSEAAYQGLVKSGVLERDEAAASFVREGGLVRLADHIVERPPGSHTVAAEMAFEGALEDLSKLSGRDSLATFDADYATYSENLQRWREANENRGPSTPSPARPSEAGFLKVGREPRKFKDPTQPKPPETSRLARWFSSEGDFEAAGDLRSTFSDLRGQATGETKSEIWRASRNWEAVQRRIPKAKAARQRVEAQVIDYLEAPPAQRATLGAQLPPGLVEPLEKMRAHMATLQLRAIATPGLLSDEMAKVYGSRVGQHLTRGYEAFINPKYLDDVQGTKLWDDTFDWLRQEEWTKKMSDAEVEGWMEGFVKRGPQMFRPVARGEVLGKKGALGAYREDIPDQLQKLLGRIDDPEYRYKRTVERLAPDIAEQTMLNEMYELGEGKLFFDKPIAGFSEKIPGVDSKDPLGGKYTTPEMAEVIAGFRGMRSREPGLVNWFVDNYLRANAFVKTGFTAYSPTTHVRNSGSWGLLGLATGHGIAPVRRATQAVRSLRETGDATKLLSSIGIKNPKRFDSLWEEGLRLGVVGQSVNVGHLEDYARWVARARKERGAGRGVKALQKPFDVTADFAQLAYGLEDDLPKFALWIEEMKNYRKALPNAPDTEIMRTSARNIRNITPTWDKVPRGIREISRFPLFAMFPGFQAEMVRNTKNLLKLSVQEIRSGNPRLRKIGLKRLAGLQASLVIPEAVAVAGGAALAGVSMGEQTETIMNRREFQPEWQRNSSMLYWDAEGEDFRQLDVGFLDPRAGMKRPILATVAGILQEEAGVPRSLGRGAAQFGEAFLGTEASVRSVAEAAQNRDELGRPIANPEAPGWKRAIELAGHVGGELAPGVWRGNRNIVRALRGERWATGRQRKPWQEVLATYGGVRVSDMNVAQAAPYQAWTLGDRRQNVRRIFSDAVRSDLRSDAAKVRPETIQKARAEAQEAWEEVWSDASRLFEAVRAEGIPQAEAFLDALDSEGGWREDDLLDLVQGKPAPPVVTGEDLERIIQGQERLYRFSPELSGGTQP